MKAFLISSLWVASAAFGQAVGSAYTLSISYSEDGASALQGAMDFGLDAANRLQLQFGYSRSPSDFADASTYRAGLAFDHDFDPLGFTLGYEYWSDRDSIDSHALQASAYAHGRRGRVALTYERRRIELDFDVPLGARGFVDSSRRANSDGVGLSARLVGARIDVYAQGMNYDYDLDLSQPASFIDVSSVPLGQRPVLIQRVNQLIMDLGRLNASALTLASSLLDYTVAGGIDVRWGAHMANLEIARDATVTDDIVLNSVSLGFVHAIGERFDIEYRVGASRGEQIDSALYGSLTFFWYR